MKWMLLVLLYPPAVWAEAEPPSVRHLDPSTVHEVAIGSTTDTLLMFPEPVTLIAGKGLTGGEGQGAVQFQQAEDPKLILLRQIRPELPVLMHVVLGEEGYSFRLVKSDKPASILRYVRKDDLVPAASVIPETEIRKETAPVSKERQAQLLELALGEAALRAKIPDEYTGYRSVAANVKTEEAGFRFNVFRVGRFAQEDAIVVIADVLKTGNSGVDLRSRTPWMRVGDTRFFQPNELKVQQHPDRGRFTAAFLLIGDGKGRPLHLSPDNRFAVTIRQINDPQKP